MWTESLFFIVNVMLHELNITRLLGFLTFLTTIPFKQWILFNYKKNMQLHSLPSVHVVVFPETVVAVLLTFLVGTLEPFVLIITTFYLII